MWIYEEREKDFEAFLEKQPKDIDFVDLVLPDNYHAPEDDPEYKWAPKGVKEKAGVGIDDNGKWFYN